METQVDFNKLWNYGDPAGTENSFRELLPAAIASGDDSYRLQLQTQIARALGLQRKFDDASLLLDQVEKELNDSLPLVYIRYNLERGRVFNSSGKREEAKPFFVAALDKAKQERYYSYAVDAAHMIAIVEDGEEALMWNEKAVKIAEESMDEQAMKWLGSLYNNIGWTYHDMKNYSGSMDYFIKARDWHEKYGNERTLSIAWWCMAKGYRYLGDIDSALEILMRLNEAGDPSGYTSEELGECYLVKGDKKTAAIYFGEAYEILSKDEWMKANEAERLNRMKELSMN